MLPSCSKGKGIFWNQKEKSSIWFIRSANLKYFCSKSLSGVYREREKMSSEIIFHEEIRKIHSPLSHKMKIKQISEA